MHETTVRLHYADYRRQRRSATSLKCVAFYLSPSPLCDLYRKLSKVGQRSRGLILEFESENIHQKHTVSEVGGSVEDSKAEICRDAGGPKQGGVIPERCSKV